MKCIFQCEICGKTYENKKDAVKCEREHAEETCADINRSMLHLRSVRDNKPILNFFIGPIGDAKVQAFNVTEVEVTTLNDNVEMTMTPYIKIYCQPRKEND